MQGRKPKLAIVKESEGDRSHVGKKGQGPRIEGVGTLEPPDHLTPTEKALWRFVVASLPAGVLARADTSIMERYVVAWARWREADEAVKADGMLVKTPQGVIKHPLLSAMNGLQREMHACGAELGLSPVARQRIMATKVDPDDEMGWLMDGAGD
jgi:P27 family predicted phage terminase small subunit